MPPNGVHPGTSTSVAATKKRRNGRQAAQTDILENMTNAELTMIHRLAGNDAEVRRATIKKLRKWLRAIASKVPDSAESMVQIEGNFQRVWKAMFYCMWMADKPTPQETLAEQISGFVSIFTGKPKLMLLFVEWFFVTFAREWPWIDRLRLDKFVMLIRRFIRKMLHEFSVHNWDEEILDQFIKVVSTHLFNHHPKLPKKLAKKTPDPPKAPLGFQIHIVNIFLEELAKVGGSSLASGKILKFLTPFVNEMVENDDDRLLEEIKSRVFHHLMKQSDVGIDYAESRGGTMELVEMEDDDGHDGDKMEEDCEDNEIKASPIGGPLDPRAGQIDVILPQLEIDYQALIDMLTAAATRENTKAKNRKLIFSVVREFQKLTKGEFPLGFERESKRIPAIKRSEVESAAQRLVEMEEELKGPKVRRKDKKARRKQRNKEANTQVQLPAAEISNDSSDSIDTSKFLNDENLSSRVDENYDGFLEEAAASSTPKAKAKKVIAAKKNSPLTNKKVKQTPEASPEKSPKKLRSRKSKTSVSPKTSPEAVRTSTETSPKASKKKQSEETQTNGTVEAVSAESSSDGDTYIVLKRRRLSDPFNRQKLTERKEAPPALTQQQVSAIYSPLIKATQSATKRKQSLEGESPSPKSSKKISPKIGAANSSASPILSSGQKKKVNFVLAKNLEHPHSDYQASIQRSPAIPYDGNRTPTSGLLKSKSPATPIASRRKTTLPASEGGPRRLPQPIPRRKASDFF